MNRSAAPIPPADPIHAIQRIADVPAQTVFRLYIAGTGASSARAVVNVRSLCEGHFRGQYQLQILDVLDAAAAAAAADDGVVAVPALVRLCPAPVRRFTGDLSGMTAMLEILGLRADNAPQPALQSSLR